MKKNNPEFSFAWIKTPLHDDRGMEILTKEIPELENNDSGRFVESAHPSLLSARTGGSVPTNGGGQGSVLV